VGAGQSSVSRSGRIEFRRGVPISSAQGGLTLQQSKSIDGPLAFYPTRGPEANLDPKFAAVLEQLLSVCRNKGYDFRLSYGLRTPQKQAEYFCQWVKHPPALIDEKANILEQKGAHWLASILLGFRDIKRSKNWVTGQLPGSGWHQWGLAADCYCYRNGKMVTDGGDPVYQFYAEQAARLGLTAGFYFGHKDAGHVQLPSAAGADHIYTWSHIDEVMKARFGEKAVVALIKPSMSATKLSESDSATTPAFAPPRGAEKAVVEGALLPKIPPAATADDIKIKGKSVYGPGNLKFGTLQRLGLFNPGTTTIDQFFQEDPNAFPDVPQSLQRVVRSVSANEGKLEAINTYDNAFLSVGIFQWTAGSTDAAGELAGLLALLKARSPRTFATYFGDGGLDVEMKASPPHCLRYGYLILNGQRLDTANRKGQLRTHLWAYRFWRACHDTEMRRAQLALAMSRIDTFYNKAISGRNGRSVKDYISSEYGVALLLDEHVNRPGHVPKTVMAGVDRFVAESKKEDPAKWTDRDEAAVLTEYLAKRADSGMTDSSARAKRIAACAKSGTLSTQRGSFAQLRPLLA